jgi:anaerobic carbon-monoxide dehydrogenase iron sulfur subunit
MKYLKTNPTRCKGVRACEKACSQAFFKIDNPEKSAIRVKQTESGFEINVCDQCGECILVCPVEAITRNKQGVVMIKKSICVGCYICVGFCPTLSMFFHPDLKEPFKCVACGLCVKPCPEKVLELSEKEIPAPNQP